MNKFTSICFQKLQCKLMLLVAISCFSISLQASEKFIDNDFFYITGEVTTATGPGIRCSSVEIENLVILLEPGAGAVLDNDNFDPDNNPDCEYGFSLPPNDTLYETELAFSDPGMYDAFFYILGATANTTPVGPCPFSLTVTGTSSNSETELPDVEIFPNPTKNTLKLEYPNYQFDWLELYNSGGAIVRKEEISVRELDVSNLSKGVYFLKIHFKEGVVNRKIVKD